MIYVYAPSMPTIFFSLQEFKMEKITILTTNPSIKIFCETSGINLKFWERNSDTSLKGMFNYKNKLHKIASELQNNSFLFCYTGFDLWGLYLMRILKKKNKVFFFKKDPVYPKRNNLFRLFESNYRKIFFNKLIYLIVTRKLFDIFEIYKTHYYLGQSEERCKKTFLEFTSSCNSSIFTYNLQKILKAYNIPDYDVLFIDDGGLYYKFNIDILTKLMNILTQKGYKIAVKPHPTFQLSNNFFNDFQTIPKSIPSELLINKGKLVIGVLSSSLVFFAKYQPTISLTNLVAWKSDRIKKVCKTIINQGKIKTPDNITELLQLIKYIKII